VLLNSIFQCFDYPRQQLSVRTFRYPVSHHSEPEQTSLLNVRVLLKLAAGHDLVEFLGQLEHHIGSIMGLGVLDKVAEEA